MLTDYKLTFPSGSLITGQLLQKMFEYPKNLINYIFADYSEGVISGLNISYKAQKLILSPGIYKHNSSLYILERDEILKEDVCFEGKDWYAVLRDSESDDNCNPKEPLMLGQNNIVVKKLEIEVKELQEGELEKKTKDNLLLFSFKNEPRFPESEFDIKNSAYILDYRHACRGKESTFMPQLFDIIYKKLCSKEAKHPFDYVIMSEICATGIVSPKLMRAYISCLSGYVSTSELQGKALMDQFWDALSNLKGNNLGHVPTENVSFIEEENESWLV